MAARAFPKYARKIAVGIKRVSLIRQVGNYSFDGQGNKFALLAEKFDCDIPPELMIEDKGYSGTDFNRPSIKRAKEIIRSGAANAVAFPWLDRFARQMEGGLATIREFRELGAEVLLGDLGWYRDEGWYIAQMQMFLMIAEYQRRDIADKSKWAVEAKLQNGFAHFGAPFGWRMITAREIAARALNAGQPVPLGKPRNFYERVLDDLDTVLLMGEIAIAGGREGSQRGICRELDARGIKTPKFKRLAARGETCISGWNATTVDYIVRDLIYSSGIWYYGKRESVEPRADRIRKPDAERHRVRSVGKMRPREEWAGKMEMPGGAVWTPDEQAAILEAVKRNGEMSVGKPARPREEGGYEAMLKGLCTCSATRILGEDIGQRCGQAMVPWQHTNVRLDGTRLVYYRCVHRHRTQGHCLCDAKHVRAEVLEPAVWERVKCAVCEELPDLISSHFKGLVTQEDERVVARLREEFRDKRRCLSEVRQKGIEARDVYAKEDYAELVAKYSAELQLLDRRIRAASSESDLEQLDIASIQRDAREAFETDDPADRRRIAWRWIEEVRYAHGAAEITIAVNCQSAEHAIGNKQPLYLTVNTRMAA